MKNCNSILLRVLLVMIGSARPCLGLADKKRLELADVLPENGNNYEKLVSPAVSRGPNNYDPAEVEFNLLILGLVSIDEASMTFSTDLFFDQTWHDYRLKFPSIQKNCRVLDIEWLQHIWQPDTYFRNAKSVQFQLDFLPNHYLQLCINKTVMYTMKLTLQLSCDMDFAFYPHDTQECRIYIESLYRPFDELRFKWANKSAQIEVQSDLQLPQLRLMKVHLGDCTYTHNDILWPCLEVVFTLKRSMGYYLINTYIPTCLIVVISWISLWMSPKALTARVSLGVTILLTLSYQHTKSLELLAHVSYFKLVDAFMLASTIFVFLGLIELGLVIATLEGSGKIKSNKVENADSPRKSMQRLHHPSISSIETIPCDFVFPTNSDNSDSFLQRALLIDRVSRTLFPISFVILNCVYWFIAFFHEKLFGN